MCAEKTAKQKKWSPQDYFRLGKLMHYIADAFTCPHNESFTGTLWSHRIYEAHLHPCHSSSPSALSGGACSTASIYSLTVRAMGTT
ncbi:MAG TPA: zinc dependent phospholipase C family protein [Pseudoflavonifractor sp.]|nr:zinc dependent phospholipase C family protein [Pseudoflavonifractor sp.]